MQKGVKKSVENGTRHTAEHSFSEFPRVSRTKLKLRKTVGEIPFVLLL